MVVRRSRVQLPSAALDIKIEDLKRHDKKALMKNKCLFCKKHLHFEEKEYIMRKYITLSGQSDKEKYKTNKK